MTHAEALARVKHLEGEVADWRAAFSVHYHNTEAVRDLKARVANLELLIQQLKCEGCKP